MRILVPGGVMEVERSGVRFLILVDDIRGPSRSLAFGQVYEPLETKLISRLLERDSVFIDVGANLGYYSLLAWKSIGPKGKVYAIEPEPTNYRILEKNINLNLATNVSAFQIALSDREGDLTLFRDRYNLGAHSISRENVRVRADLTKVNCLTLDEFIRRHVGEERVSVIKLDVQGAEGRVLRGARETFGKWKPTVVLEYWPFGLLNCGTKPEQVLHDMSLLGYAMKYLDEERQRLVDIDPFQLLELGRNRGKHWFVNVLFWQRERGENPAL